MGEQKVVPISEVEFVGLSFTDFNGRLFRWNGELYRAIPAQSSEFYRKLFESGLLGRLVEDGLFVDSAIADLHLEGFDLVVWHRTISPVVYPHEWCGPMLRDAAEIQVRLAIELEKQGLTCGDAHPLNIVFDQTKPVFVDLGSIVALNESRNSDRWHKEDQFETFFLKPLRLIESGHSKLARWLLRDHPNDPAPISVDAMLGGSIAIPAGLVRITKSLKRRLRPTTKERERLGGLEQLLAGVSERYAGHEVTLRSPTLRDEQACNFLADALADLAPSRVLDISTSATGGSLALLAASSGIKVVAADPDEQFIGAMYHRAKAEGLAITHLVLDAFSPGDDLSNYWYEAASGRLNSDLVLAVGTLDKWVLEDHIRIDVVAERLWGFTSRWLLLDFVSRPTAELPTWSSDRLSMFSSFTLEQVVDLFAGVFGNVTVTQGEGSRFWLLCERSQES